MFFMEDWNPGLYLRFKDERTRPVFDLIARIKTEPKRILDIGCGPGNSTSALKARFGDADITGLDFSETMIDRAKRECPGSRFIVGDAGGDLSGLGAFDLIFANASLQWLPKHDALLRKYADMLTDNGAIAMQIPQFDRMPIANLIDRIACSPEYTGFFSDFESGMHYYPDGFYYDTLSAFGSVDIWSTEYFHVLTGHYAIIDWISSTGLRPYTERLPKELQPAFIRDIRAGLRQVYPQQKDGKVLFPFRRLFFIVYKKEQ
jgi:Trans-aconitate methyltransferase